jgi:hypothetical protein
MREFVGGDINYMPGGIFPIALNNR